MSCKICRKLHKISKSTYDEKYGDRLYTTTSNQTDGVPVDFSIYALHLYLGPVPDSVSYRYYMNYSTEDYATIISTTDPVPFSTKYRSMLRAGVLADIYAGLEFFDEANYWRQLYVDGLLKLKAVDDNNIYDNELVAYHGI